MDAAAIHARRWWTLAVMCLSLMVIGVDNTILNVALPTLVREAKVAVAPGVGFGPGGEGFVRFALIENEQRIAQASRQLRRVLIEL